MPASSKVPLPFVCVLRETAAAQNDNCLGKVAKQWCDGVAGFATPSWS